MSIDPTLARLREVTAALGFAPNPDDFKQSVQDRLWSLALTMIREATARDNSIYRENRALREELNALLTQARESQGSSAVEPKA